MTEVAGQQIAEERIEHEQHGNDDKRHAGGSSCDFKDDEYGRRTEEQIHLRYFIDVLYAGENGVDILIDIQGHGEGQCGQRDVEKKPGKRFPSSGGLLTAGIHRKMRAATSPRWVARRMGASMAAKPPVK